MSDEPATDALQDRIAGVRNALSDARMTVPASEIFARHERRRTRKRLAAAGGICAAIVLVVALALALLPGSPPQPARAHLAAWTVHVNANGTVDFTLRNTSHPAQLQHRLAAAGIPAFVRWRMVCEAGGGGQPLISTLRFLKSGPGNTISAGTASYYAPTGTPRTGTKNPGFGLSWVINPAKMPRNGHFVISAEPGPVPASRLQGVWEFARTSAPVACARIVRPGERP